MLLFTLNPDVNIFIGDNDSGKSTIFESQQESRFLFQTIAFVMKRLPKRLKSYEEVCINIGDKTINALKYQCAPKPM